MIQTHVPSSVASDRVRPDAPPPRSDGRSIFELLRELRDESSLLIRQEVELARTEAMQKATSMLRNVGYIAAGALIGFAGFIFLLWSLTLGLMVGMAEGGVSQGVVAWLGPLLVGMLVLGFGAAFIIKGVATLRKDNLAPRETVQTLKENKQWLTAKLK